MNCKDIGEELIGLATGDAPVPEVETHLRSCASCARRFEELRRTMALLDEWKAPQPSPYFDTRLQARLREEAAPRGWMGWFRKPVLAAAMTGLLVLGGVLFTTGHKAPTVPAAQSAAVQDLQDLDKNHDLFANFDLLDDISADQKSQDMNP